MNFYKTFELDEQKIAETFNEEFSIGFRCYTLDSDEEDYLSQALRICLDEIGKDHIYDYINYIYRELLNNAKKANLKRIYFDDIDLDIKNEDQYKKGMSNFKSISMDKIEEYNNLLEKRNLYIQSVFKIEDEKIHLIVKNNVLILEKELEIVNKKIRDAKEFSSIEEAITVITENKEGAGLGLIISTLMLKKMGQSTSNYKIQISDNNTIAHIELPLTIISDIQRNTINDAVINEIKDIPPFPEHIMQLQKMAQDPDVNIKKLSLEIMKDPSLTGKIIHTSNSAIYSPYQRVTNITNAVKIIGLKGIRNILLSYGTEKILTDRYKIQKINDIFNYSQKVALLSFQIARTLNLRKDLEDIYIAGILHDIGKIVVLGLRPDLINRLNTICHQKNIPLAVIDSLTDGFDHQIIGALLAEKWDFPESLVETLKFHHEPTSCNEEYKHIVYSVFLGSLIETNSDRTLTLYNEIPGKVKDFFNFTDRKNFFKFISELKRS